MTGAVPLEDAPAVSKHPPASSPRLPIHAGKTSHTLSVETQGMTVSGSKDSLMKGGLLLLTVQAGEVPHVAGESML